MDELGLPESPSEPIEARPVPRQHRGRLLMLSIAVALAFICFLVSLNYDGLLYVRAFVCLSIMMGAAAMLVTAPSRTKKAVS